jgi:hypothetical protein
MSLINTASYSLDSRLERLASGRRRRRPRQQASGDHPQGRAPQGASPRGSSPKKAA